MSDFTVTTDKSDYQPGDTALFSASTVDAGATVSFSVAHVNAGLDGVIGTEDDLYTYDLTGTGVTWTVTDGGTGDADGLANGIVITSWLINDDAAYQAFQVSAIDAATGEIATADFTDAPQPTPVPPILNDVDNGLVVLVGNDPRGTGTGIFPAFVQIQGDNEDGGSTYDNDDDASTEEGFNTSWRDAGSPDSPVQDTKNSLVHNHDMALVEVPIVGLDLTNDGVDNPVQYREFRLDLGEGGGANEAITLDALKLFWSPNAAEPDLNGLTEIYNMDGGTDGKTGGAADVDGNILLSGWQSGQGGSDYKFYIPESYFAGIQPSAFIYLYSAFSNADSEFEEWSVAPSGLANPEIHIDKITTDLDESGDNNVTPAGQAITWTYTITNTGNVSLSNIIVTDDILGTLYENDAPTGLVDSFSGDTNNNHVLEVTETWVFTIDGFATGGTYSNIGSVSGDYQEETVSDTDPSGYTGPDDTNNPNASISGTKYEDFNANGERDVGDNGLKDWTIYLYSDDDSSGTLTAADTLVLHTTTDDDGNYSFGPPLALGTYIIVEGNQDGWNESPDDDTSDINGTNADRSTHGYVVTIDENTLDITGKDFANFNLIDLSGTKFTDVNGDDDNSAIGADDTEGTPGQSFTINVYIWTDTDLEGDVDDSELSAVIKTTETDATTGAWSITGLGPLAAGEKYVVKEAGETGWTQTFGNDGHIVEATSGNDKDDLDFANFKDFSLSGTKYTDVNGEDNNTAIGGDDTAGTPGQTFTINVHIWTDTDLQGDVDDSELSAVIKTTETNATTGAWTITGLGPLAVGEKYVVKEAGETGWTQTFGNDGHIVEATSGNDTEDLDFANFKNISLSGTKYIDVNGDDNNAAIGGDDTAGTPGQTFTINVHIWTDTDLEGDIDDSELSAVIKTTETNAATGAWAISDLGPLAAGEKYVVKEAGETGWTQTFGTDGHVVDPTSGGDVGDLNFANFENIDISGYKWEDSDGKGDWDAGEKGLANWTIYLDNDNNFANGYIASDTTDADGKYEFTDLGPGTYFVYEGNQASWINTYNGATSFTVESGVDHAGTSGVAEPLNFGNFHFIPDDRGLTKGFWGQHPEAWDGTIALKKGVADTANLVKSGVLEKADVLPNSMDTTPTVDWNKDGVINGGDTGILLGDANGNGAIDAGENTLFVSLAAAIQIIKSSDSSNDTRQILMSQAIAAQLNIYNGVGQPDNLIGEAVAWLTGQGPYTYANSTGDVDRNDNGVLDTSGALADYSTSTKAFLLDASFLASGTALTSNLQAWQQYVDVVDNAAITEWDKTPGTPGNQEANGEGLKNALELFNQAKLVTDITGQFVGYNGVINPNDPDYFWLTLHQAGGVTGIA